MNDYVGFWFIAVGLFGMGFFVGRYVEAVRAHRRMRAMLDWTKETVQLERDAAKEAIRIERGMRSEPT